MENKETFNEREKFSERLTLMRHEKKLTQENLAGVLGVSKATISKYEKGAASPSYKMLWKLADFFSVSVDYLIGKTNSFTGDPNENDLITELKGIFEEMNEEDKNKAIRILKLLKE